MLVSGFSGSGNCYGAGQRAVISMLRPGGYAYLFDDRGTLKERDTFTCFHCNSVKHLKPFCSASDLGGHCRICDKDICAKCVGGPCIPFEKKLEIWEARDRARRSYGV